jgi:L-seryl-tRNA(Ser) seleniumtransferase
MTGTDPAAIARLPDATGLRAEVILPAGHWVDFGAPVEQMVRLAGATPVAAGTVFDVQPFHVAAALSPRAAAGLYVVSHHTAQSGQLGFAAFCETCHAAGVPVIVDMAAEYDLRGPFDAGADLAIWSVQKFLGGPTAGIVAGRRDLVRAAWLQNRGIGRAMKVGKEGIAGSIAALEAWSRRDHAAARAREEAIVAGWLAGLADVPGLVVRRLPDWTGNPVDRLEIVVGPAAGLFAWELADRLAARTPSIRVRDDFIGSGVIHLDPCNLDAGDAEAVTAAIRDEIATAIAAGDGRGQAWEAWRTAQLAAALAWPG